MKYILCSQFLPVNSGGHLQWYLLNQSPYGTFIVRRRCRRREVHIPPFRQGLGWQECGPGEALGLIGSQYKWLIALPPPLPLSHLPPSAGAIQFQGQNKPLSCARFISVFGHALFHFYQHSPLREHQSALPSLNTSQTNLLILSEKWYKNRGISLRNFSGVLHMRGNIWWIIWKARTEKFTY